MSVRIGVGEIGELLKTDRGEGGGNDFLIEDDTHGLAGLVHGENHGGGGERSGDAAGFLGTDFVVDVEVAPAAVEVFVAVGEIDLLLREIFQSRAACFIALGVFVESGDGAQAVSVTPGIVGGSHIGTAQIGQRLEGPFFCFGDAVVDGGALVMSIDEACKREAAGTGEEGIVRAGQGCVDVETFGASGSAKGTIGILLGDEIVHALGDGGFDSGSGDFFLGNEDAGVNAGLTGSWRGRFFFRRGLVLSTGKGAGDQGECEAEVARPIHKGGGEMFHAPGVMMT